MCGWRSPRDVTLRRRKRSAMLCGPTTCSPRLIQLSQRTAIEMAKQMIAEGRLGRINHVSIRLLADYAAHPEGALTWRFKTEWSGSGVLGDLASHGVDLGRYLVGDITDLMCDAATFIAQRPQVGMTASHFSRGAGGPMGADENEDHIAALLRFRGGARGILESSRAPVGKQ